jgi:hypothetical protein
MQQVAASATVTSDSIWVEIAHKAFHGGVITGAGHNLPRLKI